MRLSIPEARRVILQRQGLDQVREGLAATRQIVEQLGYVQIDTISVVHRAHHHILWSRVHDHQPPRLAGLLSEKSVFEYWSHAASYLPMRDFRFSLPRKRI